MTYIIGFATKGAIAVTRFDGSGVRMDAYPSVNEMLKDILMNSGDKLPFLVRDELLPPAIKAWEDTLKRDNCTAHGNMLNGDTCELCGWFCDNERGPETSSI